MDVKKSLQQLVHKLKRNWETGRIQRTGRITYGVVWNVVLFFLVIGLLGLIFVGGVGAGYFASLVQDEKVRDYETMASDIYNYSETSSMFFADNIYLGDINSDLHREETTLDQIAPHLVAAVIATEDEYFNEHNGIVPKAIFRAMIQEVTNASTQTGGSTLTQQLIKNQLLTNEVSFERKAREILLAMRLERFFDKDEILEAYLNIVPFGRDSSGRNIAGIQTAAQGIFGIDALDVNLAQAAYLAGLPQSPSAYTPFASGGGLKSEDAIQPGLNRMQTVLYRMLDMEYITEEEYDEALNYDITADFKPPEQLPFDEYPVLAAEIQREAIEILYQQLLEEDEVTAEDLEENPDLEPEYRERANRALQLNGYEIHTTIDKELYDTFQEVGLNFSNYGSGTVTEIPDHATGETERRPQEVEGSAIMIENSTGKILAFFGNRDPSAEEHYNYATQATRSNGSSMKPILVYGPAMEEGIIQPGTPIADVYLEVPSGSGTHEIRNFDRRHHGLLSARRNLAMSYNIPAVRAYLEIMDINPVEKYLRKMGISSSSVQDDEYANAVLAIGGTTYGPTIEENTNAFSTVANGGKFMDGYIVEKITTSEGDVVYEHEQEPVEVFSPQTSYLLIDMMRDVISNGTASSLRPMLDRQNVDWAGKTGTSSDDHDVHFVASNPNITFATWMGYDYPDSLEHGTHATRNLSYWADFINAASKVRPELVAPDHAFQQPEGIVQRSYCAISGKLPSDLCEQAGLVKTDLFNEKFVPTERDNSLIRGNQIVVNGRSVAAGPDTPGEFSGGGGLMLNPDFLREKGYDRLPDIRQLIPQNEDRSKWERIGFPGIASSSGSSQPENDGEAPSAPSSLSASDNQLTWNASSSQDVVGYRIYRAASSGDSFSRVGSTTSTSFQSGSGDGIYHVRAVDYFGIESSPSSTITIGEISRSESSEEEEEENEPEEENADPAEEDNETEEKEENEDTQDEDEDENDE